MWCAASRMLMLQVLYLAVRYAALEALQYLTAHVKTLPIGSRMRVILPPPNQVRTRVGHLVRFLHQNDPSTKTGSGQTQGKHPKQDRVSYSSSSRESRRGHRHSSSQQRRKLWRAG